MITRPATRSHICLSCQRQLAKRAYSDLKRPTPVTSSYSTDSHVESKRLDMLAARELAHRRLENASRQLSQHERANKPDKLRHTKHGRARTENLEDLQIPRLGEESKVIVLRDSIVSTYISDQVPHDMLPVKPAHIDILSQLEEERGLVDDEDVQKHIEGFRQTVVSSWDDLNGLVDKLNDSFTIEQLEKYMQTFSDHDDTCPTKVRGRTQPLTISEVTPWRPGVSDIQDYFDNNTLRGYAMESHTPRQRVAMRLLRECWQVDLPVVTDGIGQFEIRVRRADLELLMFGPQSELDNLHQNHLTLELEKLEVFRSRGVIRVTTTNSKKEWIVQQVKSSLHRIQREKLDLNILYPSHPKSSFRKKVERTFDDASIQEVARLTDINITRHRRDLFELSCVSKGDQYIDHRISAARRLILMAGDVAQKTNHRLATSENHHGLFVSYPWLDGLNWWARLRKWYRQTSPISKDSKMVEGNGEKGSITDGDISAINAPTNSRQSFLLGSQQGSETPTSTKIKGKKTQSNTDPWATAYLTRTSATMGAVLHSFASSNPADVFTVAQLPKDIIHQFSTYVPNLSRLIKSTAISNQRNSSPNGHRLILLFKPNPYQTITLEENKTPVGGAIFSAMPLIEMRLVRDAKKSWKLHSIQAIVEETHTSVMLPEKTVDVRFEQKITSQMRLKKFQEVEEYLNKCFFYNDHLEIWPSIKLPISQHFHRGHPFKLSDSSSYKGCQEIEYLFSGFEMCKSLFFEYKGWALSYTNIYGGKSGGHRGELKLHPATRDKAIEENDFVQIAYEVADILGGTKDMIEEVVVRSIKQGDRQFKSVRKVHANMDVPSYRYFPKRIQLGSFEDEMAADFEGALHDEQDEELQIPVTTSSNSNGDNHEVECKLKENPSESEIQTIKHGEVGTENMETRTSNTEAGNFNVETSEHSDIKESEENADAITHS